MQAIYLITTTILFTCLSPHMIQLKSYQDSITVEMEDDMIRGGSVNSSFSEHTRENVVVDGGKDIVVVDPAEI